MSVRRVAIVGAGASGTVQALHLLRAGVERVTLIEREREPGRGTAYGTKRPEHLLNVPARRMIVWPDDPGHFARWYVQRGGEEDGYAPRMLFGDYLSGLMHEAPIALVAGEAVHICSNGSGEEVVLADGRTVEADAAVLALGNLRPATLPGIDPDALAEAWVDDPWYGGVAEGLGPGDVVLLIGTGLTAVDAALTLDAAGFRGRILALSRRGLMPRANLARDPVVEPAAGLTPHCVGLLRAVRARGDAIGWREAVHEVRQAVQGLWGEAPQAERRRFLRHLRPWWDVHRHRIAPAVAATIDAMQEDGRLNVAAGRIAGAEAQDGGAVVSWRPRGASEVERLRVRRIVNCSGPELDIRRAGEPLLDALIHADRIRPDSCRLGIDVDPESRALNAAGERSDSLYAIGPMTRGAFWETIAISEIAAQAQRVAARIAA